MIAFLVHDSNCVEATHTSVTHRLAPSDRKREEETGGGNGKKIGTEWYRGGTTKGRESAHRERERRKVLSGTEDETWRERERGRKEQREKAEAGI